MPMSPRLYLILILTGMLVGSSISLVYVQHLRRSLFWEYKSLLIEQDQMQVVWGQLQLERSTWAAEDRIERMAVSELKMQVPKADAVVVVAPQ
jgi:cell division protein FtsL